MATINFTANDESSTISFSGNEATVAIYGSSFGTGGKVKAEASFDNGTNWMPLLDVARNAITGVTASTMYNIKINGAGCKIKFTLYDVSSGTPNVYITI